MARFYLMVLIKGPIRGKLALAKTEIRYLKVHIIDKRKTSKRTNVSKPNSSPSCSDGQSKALINENRH